MEVDYTPEYVDSFESLKNRFNAYGLTLQVEDKERFCAAYSMYAKRWEDEELLFDELCSQALNADRVIDIDLLYKLEDEKKPVVDVVATPPTTFKKPQMVNTGTRIMLTNLTNFSPKTPRLPLTKPLKKPDSPVSLEPTQFCGAFFDEIGALSEPVTSSLFVHKFSSDMFCYGRRFDAEDLSAISIEDQIAGQLAADEDPEKKIYVSGCLLIKKTDTGDELIMLKSGVSSIQLDISALENISYFHGMMAEFECVPVSSSLLKAVKHVRQKSMPLAPLTGNHDSLRVIFAFGVFGSFVKNDNFKPLDILIEKVVVSNANALILSGPFYDPKTDPTFTIASKQNFIHLCAALQDQNVKVIVVPNAAEDFLSMSMFPTPALKSLDFGVDSQTIPSNVHFLTDPGVFDLNGVRFAVTNSQSLFLLSRNEKYKGTSQGDRMARMCDHILTQQSLCPIKCDEKVLHEQFQPHLSERPHFVIAPTVLVPMIKTVQNVVFINPKYSSKNALRYATIDVNLNIARANYGTTELNISDYSNIVVHSENAPIN